MLVVFARIAESPVIVPMKCLSELTKKIPDTLSRLVDIIDEWEFKEFPLINDYGVVSGILTLGRTPTGTVGDFLEVARGFLFPVITRGTQAVFINGVMTACRYGLQTTILRGDCSIGTIKPDEGVGPDLAVKIYKALAVQKNTFGIKSAVNEPTLTYFIAGTTDEGLRVYRALRLTPPRALNYRRIP